MNKEEAKKYLIQEIINIEKENLAIEAAKQKKESVDKIYKLVKDLEIEE